MRLNPRPLPPLSLLTLAALTPEHHEVGYLEIADVKETGDPPLDFDLVALSTYSAQIFEAYDVADYYMEHGVPVVMGGLRVTACPQEAKEHCDSVVLGEGEPHWAQLLKDFEGGVSSPSTGTVETEASTWPGPPFPASTFWTRRSTTASPCKRREGAPSVVSSVPAPSC